MELLSLIAIARNRISSGGGRIAKVCLKLLQKARIRIWLFEQKDLRIEGRIINKLGCLQDCVNCFSILVAFYIAIKRLPSSNQLALEIGMDYIRLSDFKNSLVVASVKLEKVEASSFMCLLQVGNTKCGYYVMMFMREIMIKGSIVISDSIILVNFLNCSYGEG
uniref:Uncharacterized protein n=1 Tax=Cucumis melo TaxID=3656 RepID=A0A9I9EJ13_CUCME